MTSAQQTFDSLLADHPADPTNDKVWFARFPRHIDLSKRSRCNTALIAALAARRDARKDTTVVVATIRELAEQIGASAAHVGKRTIRELEAEEAIIRSGAGWTISPHERGGFFKFPAWAVSVGLSRSALVVLLAICSQARQNNPNEKITTTYGQLSELLAMNRSLAIDCVKELEAEGAIIVHRSRAPGRHDYNNPNQYTVCYTKRQARKPKTCANGVWSKQAIRLIDRLAQDPDWEKSLEDQRPTRRMRQRVEKALGRLNGERPVDELARKIAGSRGVADANNVWGVLCHRLDQIPLHCDLTLIRMQAQFEQGLISKAQLNMAIQAEQRDHELLRHRPE